MHYNMVSSTGMYLLTVYGYLPTHHKVKEKGKSMKMQVTGPALILAPVVMLSVEISTRLQPVRLYSHQILKQTCLFLGWRASLAANMHEARASGLLTEEELDSDEMLRRRQPFWTWLRILVLTAM